MIKILKIKEKNCDLDKQCLPKAKLGEKIATKSKLLYLTLYPDLMNHDNIMNVRAKIFLVASQYYVYSTQMQVKELNFNKIDINMFKFSQELITLPLTRVRTIENTSHKFRTCGGNEIYKKNILRSLTRSRKILSSVF